MDGQIGTIPKERWMMRRWIMSVYLSLAALPACQGEPTSETAMVTDEVSQYCGVHVPQPVPWNGAKPAPTGPTEIYLFYQEAVKPRDWIVFRVDYVQAKISYGVKVPASNFGSFMSTMDLATQYAGGQQPVPPMPVGQWDFGAALVEWAVLSAPILPQVEQAGVCTQPQ
jgi:hypothetical protein